ncbi:putative serine incorporator/TMS membrane protein [Helianthus annuus]|uniref:Serine incorporator/TMS membrane protein n=1 Tax=Helianthus annuus TaxID=4232 RepID=A0A9K3DQH5_HELAN|nr:putative serine incorporator/TMS membrane protein [Helianthus annuus]KAJ0442500.1 putative serine incorporator/TMS membrane protein [Helianthus annuus]KAJ0644611.1 putative serine incorporator/TMS membrane protein [Helianthus annuus]KAJ0820989.1 putative serine incorporator/TMS membrane protein [Helianthus annuus]KAJ0835597.1 putative serine incorporator/TMS membrane protein [Helianthus annuus]
MPLEWCYTCNGLNSSKAITTCTLILGMLTIVLLVLYSALRAGSSKTFLSPPSSLRAGERSPFLESEELESSKGKKEVKAKLVSYSYAFFHIIGEHVFGHAFIVIEQFKKKLGSH